MLNYISEVYKDDAVEFEKFLGELEKSDDASAEKTLEAYNKILNDSVLPQHIIDIYYWSWVYNFAKNKRLFSPPKVVEEDRGSKVINYNKLTMYIIKFFCVVTFKRITYIYFNNRFRENEGVIEKTIENVLLQQGVADKKKIRDTVNEVMARIIWRTSVYEYPFNKFGKEFIPLKNGVLWRGNEYRLLPHSPVFGYTYCLPVLYNPDATCPKIEKFLSEVVEKENIQILYEIPASCLLQSPDYHFAYMLVGSGSNGKSTYLNLIEKFLGSENISNVSLQELCEDRFKAAQLVGKLANIHTDLPKQPIKYTGRFKVLTGGDRITVERKYKDPFEFTNTARLIFAANELPEVTDTTYAFWRRWIIVEFPNKFPPNPDLIKELTTEEELSGFLNKVLEALTRLEIKGEPTRTETVEKAMEMWMRRANSVYAFVQDCIERDPQGFETKDDVYNAYVEFCEENNLKPLSKNIFSQELQKYIRLTTGRKKIGGERVYVWYEIKLKCREKSESRSNVIEDWNLEDIL